jgi:hypothetical protein
VIVGDFEKSVGRRSPLEEKMPTAYDLDCFALL